SAGADKTVHMWDEDAKKEPQKFEGHTDKITSIAISADGRRLVSGSLDKTVRVWDLETGRELNCLKGHTLGVLGVDLSADGRLAISGGQDKTVRLWDVKSGKELGRHTDHKGWVYCVALATLDKSSAVLLSSAPDGLILVKAVAFGFAMGKDGPEYDTAGVSSTEKYDGRTGAVYAPAFFPEVGRFWTGR